MEGDERGCFELTRCATRLKASTMPPRPPMMLPTYSSSRPSQTSTRCTTRSACRRSRAQSRRVDAQVYRGDTFGNFFEAMGNNTDKPVLLTEYGVDAYHDVCGQKKETDKTPCANVYGDNSGSREDEVAQMKFAVNLTLEIDAMASDYDTCASSHKGQSHGECTCIGGFLMSWTDEYWKGAKSQAACDPVRGDPKFSLKTCDPSAHVTCGNWDAMTHDICGYPLQAAPDHYVNEEWFGITSPSRCSTSIDALRPRETFWAMRKLWTGEGKDKSLFNDCDDMLMGRCIALGDGGRDGSRSHGWVACSAAPRIARKANLCRARTRQVHDQLARMRRRHLQLVSHALLQLPAGLRRRGLHPARRARLHRARRSGHPRGPGRRHVRERRHERPHAEAAQIIVAWPGPPCWREIGGR